MPEQTIEQQAALMGWVSKERFRGEESKWVDAEAFVEKGKLVMPIIHKNNERLLGELGKRDAELARLTKLVNDQTASMADLQAFHLEATKIQVEAARKEIIDGLKQAKAEGDVDAEVAHVAQLSEFDAAQKEAGKKVVEKIAPPTSTDTQLTPEFKNWNSRNTWYGVDLVRTGAATGIANDLRAKNSPLTGEAFLDAVTEGVNALFGAGSQSPVDRVEGSRGGASGSRNGPATYTNLPPEARAQCDKEVARFVGEGKVFKDTKAWQAHFVKLYSGE